MPDTLVIIDYGSGNLRSAAKSFEKVIHDHNLSIEVNISNKADDVYSASHIVLPGQGAFGDCMTSLRALDGMVEALEEAVLQQGKPFFGICVGMQLLACRGLEHGNHEGLGWIEGEVVPIRPSDSALKIPHMGWNTIYAADHLNAEHPLQCSISSSNHYYFVHSFMFKCKENNDVLAWADYGSTFPAIVGRDNIIGIQFHPEKSQMAGLELLSDFVSWKP